VFNHSGRGFWPFHHVLETGLDSPYRGWFHIDDATLARQGRLNAYPNPSDHGTPRGYAAWWNLPGLPKLNTDEPQVREYLFGVAEHWLRFGIDGWRLDVPTEIDDEAFWQEFRRRCRAVNPQAYLVGEIWQVAPDWLRGDRFDALMNYPLAEAILGFTAGPDLDLDTVRAHDMYREYLHPLSGAEFGRRLTDLSATYEPAVVEAQLNLLGSHDAPRLRTIVGGGLDRVRMATLLQMTLAGAPCIYYGDEIGMTGGVDPANRGAFTWDEEGWEMGVRGPIAELTRLRRAEPAFRDAAHRIAGASDAAVAIERGAGTSRFIVAANAAAEPVSLDISLADARSGANGRLAVLPLTGFDGVGPSLIVDGRARLELAPMAAAVLRVE
jgi:glycosidase